MTGILERRRAMMMQAAAAPAPSNDIVPTWLQGTISAQGVISRGASNGQYTELIPVPAGATAVKRNGQASYDGAVISLFVHAYDVGENWQAPRPSSPAVGGTVSFSYWNTRPEYIKFSFSVPAASGKAMTDSVRAACYGAEWVY